MTDLRAVSLLPFVPSGSDYDASRRLFADLGFQELWENAGYAGFRNGDAQFILQKYDVEAFAENLMMRLNVQDLDLPHQPTERISLGQGSQLHRSGWGVLARWRGMIVRSGRTRTFRLTQTPRGQKNAVHGRSTGR